MKVLVIGSGAREHALALRLSADPAVTTLICAPGNAGIARHVRVEGADIGNPDDLLALAVREQIDLTVVGPELPLSVGVADRFAAAGRLLLGPTAAAAQLESSKAFAKAFMDRHHVPTARFTTCDNADAALACVRCGDFGFPVVLKADGLAAGKGVVIADDLATAEAAINAAMTARRFGPAGARLVIEECLVGPEVSFFVLSDGIRALPIGTAQDHKRIFDGDRGPNTGGMGAFAPSPLVDLALGDTIMRDIVAPVVAGMNDEGHPFRGFLYVGLMLTCAGPKVIEFNVRLGDPEAQVILPLIDEPLAPLLAAAAAGDLHQSSCRLSRDTLVAVVLASRGYPESVEHGQLISGLEAAERVAAAVFHGGTARTERGIVTAGGRVLTVVGRAPTFKESIANAYEAVAAISFEGLQYRRDIGRKAL